MALTVVWVTESAGFCRACLQLVGVSVKQVVQARVPGKLPAKMWTKFPEEPLGPVSGRSRVGGPHPSARKSAREAPGK